MSTSLPRLTTRLAVPLLALAALIAAGDPIPAPAAELGTEAAIEAGVDEAIAAALQQEAETIRVEAEAAKQAAHRAARMRWFLTLPAASSKRCAAPGCAS